MIGVMICRDPSSALFVGLMAIALLLPVSESGNWFSQSGGNLLLILPALIVAGWSLLRSNDLTAQTKLPGLLAFVATVLRYW